MQRRPGQELRLEPEDEVADVADGQVEAVDRALDPSLDLVRVLAHELRDVLERESDRVDALDDPVVEVAADPLALVDDREALDLLEQSRVLDGDPGVEGEGLDQALVVLRELRTAPPCRSGRGCPTERPFTVTGTPRKLCIGGWFGGKPWRRGSIAMSGIRRERFSRMIRPRKPWPVGQSADRRPRRAVDAGRDEPLDDAVRHRRCRGPRSERRRAAGPGRR